MKSDQALSRSPWTRVAGLLLALPGGIGFFDILARHVWGLDSDSVTPALQANAMLHGNLNLHGWWFLLDPFWTVDALLCAVTQMATGFGPGEVYAEIGLVCALVVLVSIGAARQGFDRRGSIVATFTVCAIIALPTNWWALLFLRSAWHVASVLYCLVALWLLHGANPGRRRMAFAAILLGLGQVGDLQVAVYGTAAVAVAGILVCLVDRNIRSGARHIAVAVAAPLLAEAIHLLLRITGGYQTGTANAHASLAMMKANVQGLSERILQVFGGGFGNSDNLPFAHTSDLTGAVACVVVLTALVILASDLTVMSTTRIRGKSLPPRLAQWDSWRLDAMLLAACITDLALYTYACLDSTNPMYLRYLTPFVVLGTVATARVAARIVNALSFDRAAATAALAVVVALTVVRVVAFSPLAYAGSMPVASSDVVGLLNAHHLTRGVGAYWDANVTTVTSHGRTTVAGVVIGPDGRLQRDLQLSDAAWYTQPFQYVLLGPGAPVYGLTAPRMESILGRPSEVLTTGAFTVLVYPNSFSVSPD